MADIIIIDSQYAKLKGEWPSNACICGSIVYIDLAVEVLVPPEGKGFFTIKEPYRPAKSTYVFIGVGAPILINSDGSSSCYFSGGELFLHVVYAVAN